MDTPPSNTTGNAKPAVVVLCDGTWCGSETGTKTNISLLAEMIGIPTDTPRHQLELLQQQQQQQQQWVQQEKHQWHQRAQREQHKREQQEQPSELPESSNNRPDIKACYFPGSGLRGTFPEYLFNGATGNDIARNCMEVYEYIVQHFTPEHEIWMFGLSRGAYTVRCVAGMINNCGILRRRDNNGNLLDQKNNGDGLNDQERSLCKEVYRIYRSHDPVDHPEAPRSIAFKRRASYDVTTPVKFMGLFDTVGGLGIPYLNPGIGLTFNEFHDTKVSAVVEKVYHALSIHDRLWIFEPCYALPAKHRIESKFEIHESWFPGCHYDLGRQELRFFRSAGEGVEIDELFGSLSKTIKPNQGFADLVLKWMLESMKDCGSTIILRIEEKIKELATRMKETATDRGSGDVYSNLFPYGPLGNQWESLDNTIVKPVLDSGSDTNEFMEYVNPIGNILWNLARFNIHVGGIILRKTHLNNLPFVNAAIEAASTLSRLNPFSERTSGMWNNLAIIWSSQFLSREFRIITDVLAQTRDRRIADVRASVAQWDETITAAATTGSADWRPYKSMTFENFKLCRKVIQDDG
ncbi:hypothetical protein BGZ88_003823 [Linnemannia elongata]|nr:hypothetical protein BGZ88_003823 [Linnemannia elongata]